jgi:hypothetical protein
MLAALGLGTVAGLAAARLTRQNASAGGSDG